jgi:hypothetical protein
MLDLGVSRFTIHSPSTQKNALVFFWWQEKVGCRPILPHTHLSKSLISLSMSVHMSRTSFIDFLAVAADLLALVLNNLLS